MGAVMATRYGLDGSGLEPRWRHEIFSYPHKSRTAVGPTQPPAQWVTGPFPPVEKRPGSGVDHHQHYLAPRLRMSRTTSTSEALSAPAWHVTERPLPFHERVEEVNIDLKWTSLQVEMSENGATRSLVRLKLNSYLK
jgi:hypothetical protein